MFWRIFWEVAAAAGLIALGTVGVRAVLSLDSLEDRVRRAEAQVAALAMSMTSPLRCDATTQECTTAYNCKKPKCYVRSDK